MIIDHDETARSGQVVTLSHMPAVKAASDGVEERTAERTMPLPQINWERVDARPTSMVAGTLAPRSGISFIKVKKPAEKATPKGVEQDTATFALPAVEKLTGNPSVAPAAHRTAARVQDTFRNAGWNVLVWYGEHTEEFWVMDERGLHSFPDVTAMYRGMGWQNL